VRSLAAIAAIGIVSSAAPSWAQDVFPSRPISLIVPYAAGGSTDQLGRALAEALSRRLKQSVVIENKPGAGGTLGALQMTRAKPDGYSLTMIPLSVFRQPYLQPTNYNPIKDISYISTVANYSYAIGVRQDAKWKTLKDLVDDAKANPNTISYGTSALYSTNHVMIAELERATGAALTHIPYKGDSEAITALLGGHIQVVSSTSTVLPFAQSGKVRLLATGGETRAKDFPDVPTLKEQGYPVAVASPLGIGGPAGMPPAIVEKLDTAIREILADPAFVSTVEKFGIELAYRNHQQYSEYARVTFAQEKSIIERLSKEAQK
jgi:tripartite-type tricarboxylate transporter receptor subunit TctC